MEDQDMSVEIARMDGLDLTALRQRWQDAFGHEAPPRMSREVLVMALAHDLQVKAFGGLPHALRDRLYANGRKKEKRSRPIHTIRPGTRFIRMWQGRRVEAVAMEDGRFDHEGQAWPSLSAIARHVTGTRWSGPKFFGLGSKDG